MSLTKRDIELIQLGFKCFENPPKVNFEKLASIAGLKNASSAQTCYNGAKRKFLNGAGAATSAATIDTGSNAAQISTTSAPAIKKRKTSVKTTTVKPSKGKGGKGSTAAGKGISAVSNDEDADDADDDAEDDEEVREDSDIKELLAFASEENAANAAAWQLKTDQDAYTVSTPVIEDHHAAAKTTVAEKDVNAKEMEPTTVVKAEEQEDQDVKANDLLREALQMAMNAARDRGVDLISSGNTVDLSEEGADGQVVETSMAAVVKTVGGLNGAEMSGNVDQV